MQDARIFLCTAQIVIDRADEYSSIPLLIIFFLLDIVPSAPWCSHHIITIITCGLHCVAQYKTNVSINIMYMY